MPANWWTCLPHRGLLFQEKGWHWCWIGWIFTIRYYFHSFQLVCIYIWYGKWIFEIGENCMNFLRRVKVWWVDFHKWGIGFYLDFDVLAFGCLFQSVVQYLLIIVWLLLSRIKVQRLEHCPVLYRGRRTWVWISLPHLMLAKKRKLERVC